ncbi:hypothetical protein K493DRAFT_310656 [Basidiobolus meristosporus CBS 931.73]|uniref:RING-type domain-containing protein n=1 Tax=Basidiobolus meristosporus CBS 931.73 TaxID=1314790 RepID=A0A1Y1Z7Q9_9FUNG|nr:hypothetical protein K493DRAFT_310656 [Basidiobolus meristosporus CBS 931.73]|eukprot:ORY06328.1 hypothetical protein K493DRAFT_310656 [Basidiobolus meristosporus CBS 931.73]
MLDDLDQNTWVLEPEKPSRDIMMRRIALGNLCSLQVDLNPQDPHSIPQCQIFGAESAIAPIRKLMNENLRSWDPELTTRKNLERLLSIQFPSRHTATKNELNVECGICYSYRLDESIPDQLCTNDKCGQPFHNRCLYEWLRAVPSTRQSFNTLFGLCPYCNDTITTKVVDI